MKKAHLQIINTAGDGCGLFDLNERFGCRFQNIKGESEAVRDVAGGQIIDAAVDNPAAARVEGPTAPTARASCPMPASAGSVAA